MPFAPGDGHKQWHLPPIWGLPRHQAGSWGRCQDPHGCGLVSLILYSCNIGWTKVLKCLIYIICRKPPTVKIYCQLWFDDDTSPKIVKVLGRREDRLHWLQSCSGALRHDEETAAAQPQTPPACALYQLPGWTHGRGAHLSVCGGGAMQPRHLQTQVSEE
jgi:hypothetical protein